MLTYRLLGLRELNDFKMDKRKHGSEKTGPESRSTDQGHSKTCTF